MGILGHGVDIVSLRHIESLLSLNGADASDWLSSEEIELSPEERQQRLAFIAGRIAAKEAVVKALGIGFAGDIVWSDVAVLKDEGGAPRIHLHGSLLVLASERGVTAWFISISHSDEQVIASAIAVAA